MERTKIAVFVDVENLTQWIKNSGPEQLLSELSSIGQVIVRRAYGNWTNQNLQSFQGNLNRQGFELIHNFHPVSGKNSSDIQLTIDVMEYALRLSDVNWFILATGDSDFSPLFRRLREMGKDVVGVGPRSPLSESVKTSCTRFIYTDQKALTDKEVLNSALDDATDLAEKALKTFDSPALCSMLKNRMINIDSAFDEKSLGFKSFTAFLKSIDSIMLKVDSNSNDMRVSFASKKDKDSQDKISKSEGKTSISDLYRGFLRKKKWRSIPKSFLLEIHKILINLEPLQRSEVEEIILQSITNNNITSTEVKKAMSLFVKASLFCFTPMKDHDELLWQIEKNEDFLQNIDQALLARLLGAIKEHKANLDKKVISDILYGEYTLQELDKMLSNANMEIKK